MGDLRYLLSAMPASRDVWTQCLSEIFLSDSLEIGVSYNESLSLLLSKYRSRKRSTEIDISDPLGLDALIKRLAALKDNTKIIVFPLKKSVMSGHCFVIDDEIIGCAFIKRGRACSQEGLWIEGKKLC